MKNDLIDNSISVAMCTFEGSKFLEKQLESIAKQSIRPEELIICDDGSTDSTHAIVEGFSQRGFFPTKLFRNEVRLRVVQNFTQAISLCASNYIALSDQDDIWLPNRLELTLQAMKEAEKEFGTALPLIVHSDLSVIDAGGKTIAPSFMSLRRIKHYEDVPLPNLMMQNFVTGSTILINRSLAEVALPIPAEALMHDWWLALIAAAVGKIVFIDHPTVLYRQHEANVVGADGFITIKNIKRIVNIEARERELAATVNQIIALKEHLEKRSYTETPIWLPDFLSEIKLSGIKALKAANKYGVRKQGFIRNTFFKLMLLKGGYLKYLVNQIGKNF
jgi:glycosyltransferase involved in cell wall biosynthesis